MGRTESRHPQTERGDDDADADTNPRTHAQVSHGAPPGVLGVGHQDTMGALVFSTPRLRGPRHRTRRPAPGQRGRGHPGVCHAHVHCAAGLTPTPRCPAERLGGQRRDLGRRGSGGDQAVPSEGGDGPPDTPQAPRWPRRSSGSRTCRKPPATRLEVEREAADDVVHVQISLDLRALDVPRMAGVCELVFRKQRYMPGQEYFAASQCLKGKSGVLCRSHAANLQGGNFHSGPDPYVPLQAAVGERRALIEGHAREHVDSDDGGVNVEARKNEGDRTGQSQSLARAWDQRTSRPSLWSIRYPLAFHGDQLRVPIRSEMRDVDLRSKVESGRCPKRQCPGTYLAAEGQTRSGIAYRERCRSLSRDQHLYPPV